jgi:hypothetical protein
VTVGGLFDFRVTGTYGLEVNMRNMRLEVVDKAGTATVEELQKMLAHVPGHFLVYTEGCDCTGDCHSVDIDDLAECVEIRRRG